MTIDRGVADMILQPIRFNIVTLLKGSTEPLYIEQIARAIGGSSRLIAHHLEILEDMGLVKSQFGIVKDASRPVAGRFFVTTSKADDALEQIRMSLPKARQNE
ncbi:MAG: helix-turn-helix domain-containing protein [Nitrososphaerales archaeon]|jgi:DNA-binding transcriptional ArsR family regulator